MKEVGRGNESVEKELEAEAIFPKSGSFGFSNWLQPLGRSNNNNNNKESKTRAWYGMERKVWYGIWKMPEWNGKEYSKNGMEDNLPYFHTNSIQNFVQCIYRKMHTDVGW